MPTHVMQREETEPWKPVGDQDGRAQYGSTQPQKIAGGLYPCCIMWTQSTRLHGLLPSLGTWAFAIHLDNSTTGEGGRSVPATRGR